MWLIHDTNLFLLVFRFMANLHKEAEILAINGEVGRLTLQWAMGRGNDDIVC